jgi:hypothetical protein
LQYVLVTGKAAAQVGTFGAQQPQCVSGLALLNLRDQMEVQNAVDP